VIKNTFDLTCKRPCLLVRSVRSTVLSEARLVVELDLAFALLLRLCSSLDCELQRCGGCLCSTNSRGVSCYSSFVFQLSSSVAGGGVEGRALSLGKVAEHH